MAKKPLNPIPNFIDIFFEAWNRLAIEDHLKVLNISRRGTPGGRLSLLVIISLWLQATSIHLVPTYGGLLLGLPVVGAYTLYLFLNNRKFELKGILKPSSDETFEDDVLIVDDSPTEKETAKRMEGLSLQHSTSKGKRVLGHVIVALFHLGKVIKGPIDFEIKVGKTRPKGVRKKKRGRNGKELSKAKEKTKLELAIDCIKRAKASGNRAKIVVFDCLYFALWFILALRADELHFVTRAKSNRIFIINGEKMKAKHILASVKSYKRYKRTSTTYYQLSGELPGFGPVKLVAVQFLQDGDKEVKEVLLVTDYLGLSGAQVVGTYLKRGQIETFFKEAKSNFMLEYYHLLRIHGISNYISFCFFCYWVAQEIRKVSGLHLTTSQMQVYFRLGLIQYLVEQKVTNIYERIPQKPYLHWIFLVVMLVNSLLVLNYGKL